MLHVSMNVNSIKTKERQEKMRRSYQEWYGGWWLVAPEREKGDIDYTVPKQHSSDNCQLTERPNTNQIHYLLTY